MTAMHTVDAAEFRDAMKPTVDGLTAFAKAVDDLEERSRPPAVQSRAMSEIAAEQALGERSNWNDPLSVTHGNGALTLRAAADYVRGFAQVFTGDERMPMWAHLDLCPPDRSRRLGPERPARSLNAPCSDKLASRCSGATAATADASATADACLTGVPVPARRSSATDAPPPPRR